ncbi:hypothetical protein [Flavobacterium sp. TSSA_36]|uniref:hypothetical protein n=1 Tax=Flavobacterium sp. TSSA_36 TaxID=3447669 RepID=UPI003F3AC95D
MIKIIKTFILSRINLVKDKIKAFRIYNLRSKKESDVKRWKENDQLFNDWNERTLLLGSFIQIDSKVIEFGAGNMILETLHFKKYTPTDIVKRNPKMLVCNLNEPITIELSEYTAAVFSGVLEYVYNIDAVFCQISNNIDQIVLSYCCSDILNVSRIKNGWLSDYSKNELEKIFEKYNYKICDETQWRGQTIYNLKKE